MVKNLLTKGKKRKEPLNLSRPKRALSPFFHFAIEQKPILIAEQPDLSPKDIFKIIAEEWKSFSDNDKIKYINLSKNEGTDLAEDAE